MRTLTETQLSDISKAFDTYEGEQGLVDRTRVVTP